MQQHTSNRIRDMSERYNLSISNALRELKTPLIIAAAFLIFVFCFLCTLAFLSFISQKLWSPRHTPLHQSRSFPFPPPTDARSYSDTSFSSSTTPPHPPPPPPSPEDTHPPPTGARSYSDTSFSSTTTPPHPPPPPPPSPEDIHPPSPITLPPLPSRTSRRRLSRIGTLTRIDSFTGYQLRAGVVSACDAVARAVASLRGLQPVRRSRTFSLSFSDSEEGRSSGGGGRSSRAMGPRGMDLRTSWDPLLSPRGSVASPSSPPVYGWPYRSEPAAVEVDLGVV